VCVLPLVIGLGTRGSGGQTVIYDFQTSRLTPSSGKISQIWLVGEWCTRQNRSGSPPLTSSPDLMEHRNISKTSKPS